MSVCSAIPVQRSMHFAALQNILPCTSEDTSPRSTWYPLCTAGLSSAHEVLTADTLQIYCSDTADGHGSVFTGLLSTGVEGKFHILSK